MKHQSGLWHNEAHGYRLITVYLDHPMSVRTIVAGQSGDYTVPYMLSRWGLVQTCLLLSSSGREAWFYDLTTEDVQKHVDLFKKSAKKAGLKRAGVYAQEFMYGPVQLLHSSD